MRWRYPWLRQAERLAELDRQLPAVLRGDAEPATATERLEYADLCQHPARRLHAAAARFAAAAFAAEANLANDLNKQYRYSAACSAALAAAGQAEDAKHLPDKVQAALRRQALQWLRADLTLYARFAESDDPKVKQTVLQRLTHWQGDADFVSVRDPEALAGLPEPERDAWQQLWSAVEAIRQRASDR